jgi:uncharacterized protein
MYNLSWLYEKGQGVKINYLKSIDLLTKASDLGYIGAYEKLGLFYYDGKGVKKNIQKAYDLWDIALNSGGKYAKGNITRLCKKYPSYCKNNYGNY